MTEYSPTKKEKKKNQNTEHPNNGTIKQTHKCPLFRCPVPWYGASEYWNSRHLNTG